jgi:hypothetical protein
LHLHPNCHGKTFHFLQKIILKISYSISLNFQNCYVRFWAEVIYIALIAGRRNLYFRNSPIFLRFEGFRFKMDNRIPTAYKVNQGTGYRGGTGMREVQFNSVGFQDVNVVDRPVTQQGISGIKTASQGPGRVIYDKSYYISQVRQKNNELRVEIGNFNRELDTINRDNSTYITLEKKYDDLIKEVRNLEGQLADYNLALDK